VRNTKIPTATVCGCWLLDPLTLCPISVSKLVNEDRLAVAAITELVTATLRVRTASLAELSHQRRFEKWLRGDFRRFR
jgi:hypothetical protein